jgi:predicted phosphodiesterase
MIKIQYISDLHLERSLNSSYFSQYPIEKKGDILILAGDITKYSSLYYSDPFFDDISEKFDQVFMIPGNHEYYDIQHLWLINKSFINEKIRDNVTLLNNQTIVYKDIYFIFSTLWSHISPDKEFVIRDSVADYNHIKNGKYFITPNELNRIHKESYKFIKKSLLENTLEKVFVVTHHAPTKLVVSNFHKHSPINDSFVVELHPMIFDNDIDYWLYGHTHENIDGEINGTKIISNQFGYVFSNDFYDIDFKQKIVEL